VLGYGVANRASMVVDFFDTGLLGGLFCSGGGGTAGRGLPLEERPGGRIAALEIASSAASGLSRM
jgi:hypothetical protein